MRKLDLDDDVFSHVVPAIYVLSDARGETAKADVEAAAAQFGDGSVEIIRVSGVESVDPERPSAVFHTFANGQLRREIRRELDRRGIPSIDLLGPAVTVISTLTGEEPSHAIGATFSERPASND